MRFPNYTPDYLKEFRAAAEQTSERLKETSGLWRLLFIAGIAALVAIAWNMFWWGVIAIRMLLA